MGLLHLAGLSSDGDRSSQTYAPSRKSSSQSEDEDAARVEAGISSNRAEIVGLQGAQSDPEIERFTYRAIGHLIAAFGR